MIRHPPHTFKWPCEALGASGGAGKERNMAIIQGLINDYPVKDLAWMIDHKWIGRLVIEDGMITDCEPIEKDAAE